jgi:2,4-dienoyl-CoA reductase-like NADH-dependent reductase (Old Yellow Enzyme family)
MSVLFTSRKIGNVEVANRFVHSATYERMAEPNGEVTDQLVKRYQNLAKGNVGLIVPGYMFVQPSGRAMPNQTGIYSDEMIPGLRKISKTVHEHDGKIVFQIVHAGRQTTKAIAGTKPVGPSSIGRDPLNFVKPREMNEEDIQETVGAFGQAARRAIEAGADGIQLHSAHGYLINQFLSPFFNVRTDSWGGTDENRFRFLERVYLEVKRSVPEGTPILIKLNTDDHTPKRGITVDLAKHYVQRLVDLGIDAVEISSGTTLYSFMNTCRGEVPLDELMLAVPFFLRPVGRIMMGKMVGKYDLVEAYHLDAARAIKPVLGNIPLIMVGGMRTVSRMSEIVESGDTDFVSMSRPFIREPYLVKRIKDGKADRVSCVSCNKCFRSFTAETPLKCRYKPS